MNDKSAKNTKEMLNHHNLKNMSSVSSINSDFEKKYYEMKNKYDNLKKQNSALENENEVLTTQLTWGFPEETKHV